MINVNRLTFDAEFCFAFIPCLVLLRTDYVVEDSTLYIDARRLPRLLCET